MILNFLLISVIGEYHVKLEAQTLKTDSHDIIYWSFFSFLNNAGQYG